MVLRNFRKSMPGNYSWNFDVCWVFDEDGLRKGLNEPPSDRSRFPKDSTPHLRTFLGGKSGENKKSNRVETL